MIKYIKTPVEIREQGGPICDRDAILYHLSEDTALVELDLDSKWCKSGFEDGDGAIGIYMTDDSKGCGDYNEELFDVPTVIAFPQFEEWDIFVKGLSRYTLRVVFNKNPMPLTED